MKLKTLLYLFPRFRIHAVIDEMALSLECWTFLVKHLFHNSKKYTEVVEWKFMEEFLGTETPHHITLWQLINEVCETGFVVNAVRSDQLTVPIEQGRKNNSCCILQSSKTITAGMHHV
jgi:hypothetical protein